MAFSFNQAPTGASPIKTPSAGNYLDFQSASGANFAQQYMPELYEAEVERYGNRTLSGFLSMVGAEESMTSDQVVWSEQNRLHISYTGATATGNEVALPAGHVVVPNMTVVVKGSVGTTKAIVTGVVGTDVTLGSYKAFGQNETIQTEVGASVDLFVYGSEFAKGTAGSTSNITPDFTSFSNTPIIIKDKYAINGSDTAQIGWVEVADESGTSGYLWYLKAEGETRLRFQDYLEMAMVEGEKAESGSGADTNNSKGTEGLFAAIESRGNVANEFGGNLPEFDEILKGLDKEGAIEENMLFINRQTSLDFDDMLAAVNSDYQGGTSYGVFNNEADMALNLGFSGFRRGSYDFYKTDWKYLNDSTTRGLINDIDGVIIPAGTSSVYDQNLGSNIRRPFLHVRYRSSQADDRRLKSWITGSVGAATSDVDEMAVHFLSERCLCVQGANNFVLLKA